MNGMMILGIYFAVLSIVTFAAFGLDKKKARAGQWRIKEATLLGLSLIGGALGGWIGMKVFHHKTRKKRFAIGVPLMLVMHIVLLIGLAGLYF